MKTHSKPLAGRSDEAQLQRALGEWKHLVDQRLRRFFRAQKNRVRLYTPGVRKAVALLENYTLRPSGKRIRAFLVKLGYEVSGKRAPARLVGIAAAVELIHSFLLIHDDVIDRDELRRDGPTVHTAFRKSMPGSSDERIHRANSLAIITGDLANAGALELVSNSGWPAEKIVPVLRCLADTLQLTIYGEFMDVEQIWCRRFDRQVVKQVARLKTAEYTFNGPLQIGASLGSAPARVCRGLRAYALNVGTAFQWIDDLIGLSSSRESGKSSNDLREGKITAIVLAAFHKLDRVEQKHFLGLFRKPVRSTRDVKRLREYIRKTQAEAIVRRQAVAMGKRGIRAIAQSRHIPAPCATLFRVLAEYTITRTR